MYTYEKINIKELKKNKPLIIISVIVIAILVIFSILKIVDKFSGTTIVSSPDSKLKIVEMESTKLTLEDYSNDVFSMKKPKGWKVDASGTGMYYVIRVYDPNNSNNQVFLQLKMQPLLKSEAAKEFHKSYYGNSYNIFTEAVVLSNPTTEGF